jgi:radical SAM peptide maturase (CXXX-repeat target family)
MGYKQKGETVNGETISFMITEKCNLRCDYCYEENKKHITMDLQTAKDAVDYVLDREPRKEIGIFEFIGGEPLVEFDLIYDVIKYLDRKMLKIDHPWKDNYMISLTTNGTQFTDKIKTILKRNRKRMSVGLSLDGTRKAHNLNRDNSYDKIMEDFDWWRKTFPWNTIKATVNHKTLPMLADSVKHLVGLGLTNIQINNVFENIWDENDPKIFKEQLIEVADFLIEDKKYENIHVGYFTHLYNDTSNMLETQSWCGSGTSMLSIGINGELYPCHRFQTLSKRDNLSIGNIYDGVDYNKVRPFEFVNLKNVQGEYKEKCKKCDYRNMCSWCTAWNYDESGSLFKRDGMYCEMVKAKYEANKYFFEKIKEVENG